MVDDEPAAAQIDHSAKRERQDVHFVHHEEHENQLREDERHFAPFSLLMGSPARIRGQGETQQKILLLSTGTRAGQSEHVFNGS